MNLRKKIIIVLIIAFLFRLFIIFCLPVRTFDDSIKRYHNAAVNMLEGRGYSHFESPPYQLSFYKPPVYSAFLLIIYKIFGVNLDAVRIIQAFIDTLGCLLLFLLLGHYFNEKVSFYGLVLAAVCPITAVYTNLINPESLTVFFMIFSLWLISKAVHSGNGWFFFAAGASTVLMAYGGRLELFSFVLIFGGYLFLYQIKRHLSFNKILSYALGVLIVMAPWVGRNYYLTGKFIPLGAGNALGFSILYGIFGDANNDVASLEKFYRENPDMKAKIGQWYHDVLFDRTSVEEKIEADKVLRREVVNIIKKNPRKFIVTRLKKIPRVWISLHVNEFTFLDSRKLRLLQPDFQKIKQYVRDDPKEILILGAKYLLFFINIFYLLTALIGIWQIRTNLFVFSFIILPLLYVQILLFIIHISANFLVPYWPSIIFFSAVGFYSILSKERIPVYVK